MSGFLKRTSDDVSLALNLQAFAEDAGDAGADGAVVEGGGTTDADTVDPSPEGKAYSREELDAIKKQYGLIDGRDMVRTAKTRFKSQFQKAEQLDKMGGLLDALGSRYGKEPTDYDGIAAAVMADESHVAARAAEMGVTREVAKHIMELEEQKKTRDRAERAAADAAAFARMQEMEREVAAAYPSFDFDVETQNPAFKALVDGGTSMLDAYEMIHHKDISKVAIDAAVAAAIDRTVADIRANGLRPLEGATMSPAPSSVEVDYSKLSDAELDAIIRKKR